MDKKQSTDKTVADLLSESDDTIYQHKPLQHKHENNVMTWIAYLSFVN